MKEYRLEHNSVDLDPLKAELLPLDMYKAAHQALVIPCHDIMLYLEDREAWLLIIRKNEPARDILWPIGGRIYRGMGTDESARKKVKEECGLEVESFETVGVARTFFQTDPFGHGHGTDTLNLLMIGKAKGEIQLDKLHEQPTFVQKADFTPEFEAQLHPYVQDFFVEAWKYLEENP